MMPGAYHQCYTHTINNCCPIHFLVGSTYHVLMQTYSNSLLLCISIIDQSQKPGTQPEIQKNVLPTTIYVMPILLALARAVSPPFIVNLMLTTLVYSPG
jgi:hypothetical protein